MRQDTLENTEDVSLSFLSSVVARLPAAAPGTDGINMKLLNIFLDVAPNVLQDTANYSIKHS